MPFENSTYRMYVKVHELLNVRLIVDFKNRVPEFLREKKCSFIENDNNGQYELYTQYNIILND